MIKKLPHILLTDSYQQRNFTSNKSSRGSQKLPERDRNLHARFLKSKLVSAWKEAGEEQKQLAVHHVTRKGVYLEFRGKQGFDLITKSLENLNSKIRLLNIREEEDVEKNKTTFATIFVPQGKKDFFFNRLKKYAEKESASGKPQNFNLVNSIQSIRKALSIESFWQDETKLVPGDKPEWCEVWLSSDSEIVIAKFEELVAKLQINSMKGIIRFPERSVKLVLANRSQLEQISVYSDDIAEYRRAKETASFFLDMPNREQTEWVQDLLARLKVDPDSKVSICILDTGVNNGHSLLSPILASIDCQTVEKSWGTDDHNSHGTLMAGVAGYGDLKQCLSSNNQVEINHKLESVKILPPPHGNNVPWLWGYITSQAISRAEIQAPDRKRIICCAVTAHDTRDRGRPSSWSGQLDSISSGAEDNTFRLIIIAAGNLTSLNSAHNYPDVQKTDSIHDPAQSWNSLTVGAYTELCDITDPSLAECKALAPKFGLSPLSTTSLTWEDKWPIKPEILFEGGNLVLEKPDQAYTCSDLSALSTNYHPQESQLGDFQATSAAAAQAAWFAAQIQSRYPDFWPETTRALMVHSSVWTDKMKEQFLPLEEVKKSSYKNLLRICGYGIPNLERALHSASNSLTLISQEHLQPFDKKTGKSDLVTKDMHLYELPWPKKVLQDLPTESKVSMRVTLSYFIEPGPGEIGWKDRYRYPSHGLRFDIASPSESKEEFVKRINIAARIENEEVSRSESAASHWLTGSQNRDKGSIHSDIWNGSAAELAESNIIAIFPTIGWWRERKYLEKWSKKARYSLIISISTPDESVDIYTPVINKIKVASRITI